MIVLILKECDFSFHTMSMPYHSKVMLCKEDVVLNFCKITEPRKQKLKVENLIDLNKF